jgi:3-phenylpropionate/trans-cinnamate dioxygenase ferredoxin reductase subunit
MTADDLRHVVVVGAGVAGLTAAGALRRRGYAGQLTVVGAETGPPYDRPPLSKQVLTDGWDAERVRLRAVPELDEADASWCLGETATEFDLGARVLETDRARRLAWDGLVLATGLRPRTLPGAAYPNVHTLRTFDDAVALRDQLADGISVLVVGAGVLGCELAASARSLGAEVTVVDVVPVPMLRHLGPVVGGELALRHQAHGVALRLGVGVEAVQGRDRVERVVLTDGSEVDVDVVVVAIGAAPDLGWLEGSGLPLGDGVLCDSRLIAAPGVVAAGDVASWENPAFGRRMRIEHRFNAAEQATVAATNLLGGDVEYDAVPFFWTEQLGLRIQAFGDPARAESTEVVTGDPASGRFAAVLRDADGAVVAGISWNLPKEGPVLRRRVQEACAQRRGSADARAGAARPGAVPVAVP